MTADRYSLRRPCPRCPFRTDVPGYLRWGRASEIAASIAGGAEFACHETTAEDAETGETIDDPSASKMCAGAMILMENADAPNQALRIAERVGAYDPSRLDLTAPVHRSLAAFVSHHGDDEDLEEDDRCHVCDPGCLAPAGMLIGGHAVPVEPDGDVLECPECGEPVCENCSTDGVCADCLSWHERHEDVG